MCNPIFLAKLDCDYSYPNFKPNSNNPTNQLDELIQFLDDHVEDFTDNLQGCYSPNNKEKSRMIKFLNVACEREYITVGWRS